MSAKQLDPRVRRRASLMRIVTFPVTVFGALVVIKLVLMVAVAQVTVALYDQGDYAGSAQAARWNLAVNLVEPHRTHFNLGTALLGSGLFADARDELEIALTTAPEPDSCDVRMNLSYAIEGLGDAAYGEDELEEAIELYTEAADVLADADASCPDTTDRQEELLEKAKEAQEALDEQQQEQGEGEGDDPQDPGDETGNGGDGDSDDPFDVIEERGNEAEQERQDNESADRGNSGSSPSKPW